MIGLEMLKKKYNPFSLSLISGARKGMVSKKEEHDNRAAIRPMMLGYQRERERERESAQIREERERERGKLEAT